MASGGVAAGVPRGRAAWTRVRGRATAVSAVASKFEFGEKHRSTSLHNTSRLALFGGGGGVDAQGVIGAKVGEEISVTSKRLKHVRAEVCVWLSEEEERLSLIIN